MVPNISESRGGRVLIKIPKRHLDDVVVGGNLAALLYSYNNKLPLIINKISKPHRFETIADKYSLDLWHEIYYSLNMLGLNLVGTKASNTRVGDNELNITTSDARVIKYTYDRALVFDDEKIAGLPIPTKENQDFIVLDWISALSCQMHDLDLIESGDNFVSEVRFYPSERLDGLHPNKKDLVSISRLSKEELSLFEYSDTYAKFKTENLMKEAGIGGRRCGGGNQYALKLEVSRREVRRQSMHIYENTEKLKFK
jgi:hypothetical protein